MSVVSVHSIDYRILCDGNAIIQSWTDSLTIILHRNCVAVNGIRACVRHLARLRSATVTKAILIPYSLHTLSFVRQTRTSNLEYLVFESGSGLQSIMSFGFGACLLRSLFFPSSVRFIGPQAFSSSFCAGCIHFGRRSSLRQLNASVFSGLAHVCAISIPSSVTQIQSDVFKNCSCLRVVQFEFPSQCWCIRTSAFKDCPLLEPISLPSSVEFIGCQNFRPSLDRFPFLVNGGNFLIADDCVMRTNGREVIRYLGSS
jgi:hypothetical protein